MNFNKNPAYVRNWIFWSVQIVAPPKKTEKCKPQKRSRFTWHRSRFMCHMSTAMCHVSPVTNTNSHLENVQTWSDLFYRRASLPSLLTLKSDELLLVIQFINNMKITIFSDFNSFLNEWHTGEFSLQVPWRLLVECQKWDIFSVRSSTASPTGWWKRQDSPNPEK